MVLNNNNNNNNNNETSITLVQTEYKTWHDWMGKVIHWELRKKFEFDHMKKWYWLNLKSFLENETHKIHWDFEMQTVHLISARQLDLVEVNKNKRKNLSTSGLCRSGWPQSKTERKRKER